ncbi:MAG: S8 family serine peptidase [Candidatus Eiseniibacteriota bacterium]
MPGPRPAVPRRPHRGTAFAIPAVLAVLAVLPAFEPPLSAQVRGRVLDLPLYEPSEGRTQVPAYDARKFVIELAPDASRPGRVSLDRKITGPVLLSTTGIPALDALGSVYRTTGVEPMFPAAVAPVPGSADGDLTAFYIVYLPAGAPLEQALADYDALPEIVGAEPVAIMPVSFTPNDPGRTFQFQLGQPSDRDSDVYEAWDVSQGDTTVVIAIVDTGVQYNHPDLGGPGVPYTSGNIWTNFDELGGTPGMDDDLNGFIDDFRGWDFISNQTGPPGEDLTVPDNEPTDFVGHGTFCAGMASAVTNNGVGIAGTGFRTKIMAIRAGWDNGGGGGGVVDMASCAQAINYATANGARAVNCSWSNNNLNALIVAVTNAINSGVSIVVAAGNSNTNSTAQNYLASRGDCVDVAATDSNDNRASFSNFGTWIDASAAGDNVYSTYSNHFIPTYGSGGGTSFSAPMTAGAIGLLQGYRRSLSLPLLTPTQVLLRVRDTGDNIDALNPGFEGFLATRLNVHRLLTDPPTSWINTLVGAVTTSPAIADLDNDGDDEVIVGASDQKIVAVTGALGDTIPGWPVTLTGSVTSSPAVWDIDNDGLPEIIVGTNQGWLYAINGDGTFVPGWPVQLTGGIFGAPAIADLSPASGLEVAVGTAGSRIYVLDAAGAILPGWPYSTRGEVRASPALADLDANGSSEIVVGALDSTIYVLRGNGTDFPGWPVSVGDIVFASAGVGDVDRDGAPDIVVGTYEQKIQGYNASGVPLAGWPVNVVGSVRSAPALVDLVGNDGWLEVVIVSDGPTVYAIQNDGTFAPNWPQALGGQAPGGAVVADVDGDGQLNVLTLGSDRYLWNFGANGVIRPGYPKLYEGYAAGGMSLGDADRDGRLEIYFGSDSARRLRCIDLGPGSYDPDLIPWPTFKGGFMRRGSVPSSLVAVGPGGAGSSGGLSLSAAPNPSRAATRFTLRRPAGAGENGAALDGGSIGVQVYAVSGREVRSFDVAAAGEGEATIVWDGRDAAGRAVPAGLYFVRARWGDLVAERRVVRVD